MKKFVIWFCDNLADYETFKSKVNVPEGMKLLIVSDSVDLHGVVRQNPSGAMIIYSDKEDTVKILRKDANKMVDRINQYFFRGIPDGDMHIYNFRKHYESEAPQFVLDSMVIINGLIRMIKEFSASVFYYSKDVFFNLHDEVLSQFCRHNHIDLCDLNTNRKQKKGYIKEKKIGGKYLKIYLPEKVAFIAIKTVILTNALLLRRGINIEFADNRRVIAIRLAGLAQKHVQDALVLANVINQQPRYKARIICAEFDGRYIPNDGTLEIVNIETCLNIKDFIVAIKKYFNVSQCISKAIVTCRENGLPEFIYKNVDLSSIIIREVDKYRSAEVLRITIMYLAAKKYFNSHFIDAIRSGIPNDNETRTFDKAIFESPLYMDTHFPLTFSLLTDSLWGDQLFDAPPLLSGIWHCYSFSKIVDEEECPTVLTEFVGCSRVYQGKKSCKNSINKKKLSDVLNILYAATYPTLGYMSATLGTRYIHTLCELAQEKEENLKLFVKPHPADYLSFVVKTLALQAPSKNIHIVDMGDSIHEWIERSDIVVVNVTTVALEAMAMGVPVIALTFGTDAEFNAPLGDAVVQIHNEIEFKRYMNIICSDIEEFEKWRDERIFVQNHFLKERFFKFAESPEELTIKSILIKIKKMESC